MFVLNSIALVFSLACAFWVMRWPAERKGKEFCVFLNFAAAGLNVISLFMYLPVAAVFAIIFGALVLGYILGTWYAKFTG